VILNLHFKDARGVIGLKAIISAFDLASVWYLRIGFRNSLGLKNSLVGISWLSPQAFEGCMKQANIAINDRP